MVRLKPSPTQSLPSNDGLSWHGTLYIRGFDQEDSSDDLEPSTEHPQETDDGTLRNLASSAGAEKKPSLWDQRRGGDAHPLHGNPGLEPFNDMQVLIIDAIAEIGEPAGFDQILNSVSSRWRGIKIRRRDGTPYTTDCRRAIQANLRTNPHQVSLFIRVTATDGSAAWRFSQSIEEAEEAKVKSKYDKVKEPKVDDGSLLASSSSPLDLDAITRKSSEDSSEDSVEGDSHLLLDRKPLSGRASMIGGSLGSSQQGRPVRSTRHAGGYNMNGFSSDDERGDDEASGERKLFVSAGSSAYMESGHAKIRTIDRRDVNATAELDFDAPSAKRKVPLPVPNIATTSSPTASNAAFTPPSHVPPHLWNEMLAQQAAAVAKIDPSMLMGHHHYMRPDLANPHSWMSPLFGYQPYMGAHTLVNGVAPYVHQQHAVSHEKASQSASEEMAASLSTNPSWHSSDSNPSAHMTFSSTATATSTRSSTTTSSATITDGQSFGAASPSPSSASGAQASGTPSKSPEQSPSSAYGTVNFTPTSNQEKAPSSFPSVTWS